MNTITIQWSAEDRARIDTLIEKLDKLTAHDCSKCVDSAAKYVAVGLAAPAAVPAVEEQPTENPPEPEKPVEPQKTAPAVTHADIQKKVVELSTAGKKKGVRAIVTAYSKNVSGIPEDKLVEVWEKLNGDIPDDSAEG